MIFEINSHITKFILIFTFIYTTVFKHIYKNEHCFLLKPSNIIYLKKIESDLTVLYNQLLILITTIK